MPSNTAPAENAITAESNLTYTPPPEASYDEQADFQQSLKDIVSEIEGEFKPKYEFTEEELSSDNEPGHEGEPLAEGADGAEPAVEADEPAVARGLDRLIAREVALQTKEAAFQAREAAQTNEMAALKAQIELLQKKMPAPDLEDKMFLNPSEAVKALGQDPETVVKLMLHEQLEARGAEIPQGLKDFVKDYRKDVAANRRIATLEAQLAQRARDEAALNEFNAVQLGAREYVKTVDSKVMPSLAKIATSNPDRAHREIMEEISRDAKQRVAADPNGQPLTYAEAAKRVEARLADLMVLMGATGPASDATKQADAKKVTVPPQQKPPVKPLKPWEKKGDDLYAQGIREAEREFYRQEQLNKRRG